MPPSCFGYNDASASASVQNGSPPFEIAWQPSGQVGDSVSGLSAGSYTVYAVDAAGCTVQDYVTIVSPLPILMDFQVHNALCTDSSSGYIEFAGAQGTPPYLFAWSTGDTLPDNVDLTGLAAGTYSVTVSDASGCMLDSTVTLGEPTPMTLTFDPYPASCEIASNGWDTVYAEGGTPVYNYLWSTVPQTIGGLAVNMMPGTYYVTVTDANGCSAMDSTVIGALPLFVVDATDSINIIRDYGGIVQVTEDTVAIFGYQWSPLAGLADPYAPYTFAMPDSTTTYTVTVTDINTGCQASDTVIVFVSPNPYVYVPNAFSPNADDRNDLFFPIPGDGVTIESFRIYNRWGELVFNGDWIIGWDGRRNGKLCTMDAYVYVCEFIIPDGTRKVKYGNVTLVR